jgi:hypothetical protein
MNTNGHESFSRPWIRVNSCPFVVQNNSKKI